jgi:hypothetical protein
LFEEEASGGTGKAPYKSGANSILPDMAGIAAALKTVSLDSAPALQLSNKEQ